MYSHLHNHSISTAGSSSTEIVGDEKVVSRNVPQPRRLSPRNFFSIHFFSRLFGWPGIIVLGQLLLQILAWGFFAFVQHRGGLALPLAWAASAKANPHSVQWVSTQIATILAFCSTFLFSWGARQSITLRLRGDGMSLAQFVHYLQISSRSLILNPRNLTMTFMAMFVFILTGVQTAGWSSLITPRTITIDTPLSGHGIDLSSPLLKDLRGTQAVDFCRKTSSAAAAFIVGQTESGYTAVKGNLGLPATLTVMDLSFNRSTEGILPLTLEPLNASTWFEGATTLPSTIKPEWDLPDGLGSSYTLHQQGFTADVSCEFWKGPGDPNAPRLFFQTNSVQSWNDPRVPSEAISFVDMFSDCTGKNDTQPLTWSRAYVLSAQPNYMVMIACPAGNTTKIVFNTANPGLYDFLGTTVCTLKSKTTNVEVSYSDIINIKTLSNGTFADIRAPATLAAADTLYDMVLFSQSVVSNGMGDKLRSLVSETDGKAFTNDTILRSMEQFVRGVTEYSATVFQACLATNQTFMNSLSPSDNLNIPTNGTFHTQTIGWARATSALTAVQLLPGTVLALFTIYIVVVAVAYHAADAKGAYFDPSDAMHLVAASSAGGDRGYIGKEGEEVGAAAESINVCLSSEPGKGGMALLLSRGR
ncbi:hypothetical protein R3P38DRAFT_3042215 [Favolaschia claudopus]|uniref:Uncharacterized protein n=1 Tax=Favolaschia claudopus TaxID=2862362 RepID=A0AAW0A7K7_9AGAR